MESKLTMFSIKKLKKLRAEVKLAVLFKNKETNLETQGSLKCEGEKAFFVMERGRRKSQQNSRICVLAQIKLVCPG